MAESFSLRRQWAHADAAGFDDSKVAGPILSPRNDVGQNASGSGGRRHRQTEEDDAASDRQTLPPRQLAEVFIKGEENTVLARGARQDIAIRTAGRIAADPSDIVAERAQGRHGIAGNVL